MNRPNIREALARMNRLPTLPVVLSNILATTADPDASAIELSRHVASDQSLVATLLKIVNSAYYGQYRRVDSITSAIVMLGFHEVRNIALSIKAFRSFPKGGPDFDRAQLWRHAMASAFVAEYLARPTGQAPEVAFVGGLLHDIGKVALDALCPEQFRLAAHKARQMHVALQEAEMTSLGLDHAEVGGMLCEHWQLPPAIVAVARYHHDPAASGEHLALTTLVATANFVTYRAGCGEPSSGCAPAFPEGARELGVTDALWSAAAEALRQDRERLESSLQAIMH